MSTPGPTLDASFVKRSTITRYSVLLEPGDPDSDLKQTAFLYLASQRLGRPIVSSDLITQRTEEGFLIAVDIETDCGDLGVPKIAGVTSVDAIEYVHDNHEVCHRLTFGSS